MGLAITAVVAAAIIVGIVIFRILALRADRRKAEADSRR